MSKKLLAIVAILACFLFALTGCGGSKSVSIAADNTLNPDSNGGFLVESDDYVYFINGNELYTEPNKQGNVTKGALVRVKKENLSKGKDAGAEVVVSKLLSTADYTAGLFVSGSRIFFATPSDDTNKKGEVQNDNIEFCYADVSKDKITVETFATAEGSNSAIYKFYDVNGTVYVAFTSTETDDEGTTKNYINVVNENKVAVQEEYETYVFDKGEGDYIYFTRSVENKELDITESYNELYRWKVGETAEMVYTGAGSNRNKDKSEENPGFTASPMKGVAGVKFTLIASENGYLYFSVANIDTSTGSVTYYANLAETATVDADTEENYKAIEPMTYNGSTTVFAASSYFVSPNCIVYLDTTNGLCSYNYDKKDSYNDNYGITNLYYSEDIITATLSYVKGDKLYYNISGVYYSIDYKVENNTVTVGKEETKLSPVTFSTAWYAPEIVTVDGTDYIIGTTAATDYFDYIFAYEIKTADEYDAVIGEDITNFVNDVYAGEENAEELKDTKFGDFITATKRESVKYVWDKYCISMLNDEEMTAVNDYIDTTYPLASADDSTSEDDGCSSAIGGVAMGGVILALAGVAVFKKRG